jgi:hypothetical protein
MSELIGTVAAVLAAMGLGGILGAVVQHRLESRRRLNEKEHQLKERRYLCILILMLAKLRPEIGIAKVHERRPDLANLDALDDELETELFNAVVFASTDVLRGLGQFLKQPHHRTFAEVADAMRADLWGRRQRLGASLVDMLTEIAARERKDSITEGEPHAAEGGRRR